MLALLLLACAPPVYEAAAVDSGAPAGLSLTEVRYVSAWDTEGLTRSAEGWELTNDQGYRVRVRSGWIVTNSLSLVECATASLQPQPLGLALVEATAFAGHGGETDPSALPLPVAQSLTALEPQTLAELQFTAARYCEAHQLVARVIDGAQGAPESPALTGLSLTVEGAWAGKDDAWTPFTVESSAAFGKLHALEDVEGEGARLELTLTRKLATLFDGVDFREADEDDIIDALLRRVVEDAELSFRLEEASQD
ncbi:MAG: hypothetical protein H6740_16390 [Alphaproteobacteria bacterium]|nr:hypothetical protein [Alphaproteobacteria bacterium]